MIDIDEIRKWHSIFKRDDELFEIRIIGDRTYSGYFDNVDELIRCLAPYATANIYYTINEVKKACASREQYNCFKQVRGTATSKQDIEHRWWLAVDVDCERPSGVSSTDEEKAFAHSRAQEVYKFLRDNGFVTPVVCDSSSGYHILYPIDLENNAESENVIKTFLETLSNRFTDEKVKIDVVLHDPNRILRLPGTYGRKGRSTQERPHRLAKILSAPDKLERMGLLLLKSFNDKYVVKPVISNNYHSNQPAFNLRDFIAKHNIEVVKEVPLSGGGTKYVLAHCCFDTNHKAPDAAIFEMASGAISYKCFHDSCAQYDWRAFRLHYDPNAYDYENNPPQRQSYNVMQQPTKRYEIKKELPELGSKWLSMSDIEKVDLTQLEKVRTGFNELDKRIGGLYMSEITILSGSNSSGKSSWLNTLLLNVIQQGYRIALWSGELRADILKTWIQMVAAGARNLRQSQFDEGRYYVPNEIGERIDKWMDGKFFLYNNGYGTKAEQILHDMQELLKADVKVFVLDNLMSLDVDLFNGDRNNKHKELILKIKDFAMTEKVHIILVAHPRKVMTFLRKNDISGTSDITNAADNVFIMHRTNEDFLHAITEFYDRMMAENLRQYGNVLSVEKNRLYGVMDFMVGFHYDMPSRRFKNTVDEDIHYDWENVNNNVQQSAPDTVPAAPVPTPAPTPNALSPPAENNNDFLFDDNFFTDTSNEAPF